MRYAFALLLLTSLAHAEPDDAVVTRIAKAAASGAPVVFQVHVALCDNTIIHCGGHGLGDGDNLRTNLYWGSSEGLGGWLGEQPTGWKRVSSTALTDDRLLESVWTKHVTPSATLRARGVDKPFDAYLVIDVWRGTKIDAALAAFMKDVFGDARRDAGALPAGGAASVVAWVGHNRFMDYETNPFVRELAERTAPKGVVAIACYSRPYLKAALERAGHVPLVLTNDFVMASGAPLVGALEALLDGGDLSEQRKAATVAYARGQKKDPTRLGKVFVNASSRTW